MYLFGAGGHASVLIDILKSQGKEISGLIDDNKLKTRFQGYHVIHEYKENLTPLVLSVGNNQIRQEIAERLQNVDFENIIDTTAIISKTSKIGEGTVVLQGCIIQTGSEIGKHCIINTGASIDHDSKIGDFVHIAPRATLCGNVKVGEGTWIGAGVTVIPGVKIGKWSIIGAGSVIIEDVPDNVMVAGVPGRFKKELNRLLVL